MTSNKTLSPIEWSTPLDSSLSFIHPEAITIVEDVFIREEPKTKPGPQLETNELSPQMDDDFKDKFSSVHDNLNENEQKAEGNPDKKK